MKLVIAGGRDYVFKTLDRTRLNRIENVTEVVSGGATGADREGESWAEFHRIPIRRFLPNWDQYGKRAGFMRNTEMAEYADALAIFPGGKGSAHMLKAARDHKLQIFDFRENTLF